jgi:aspartate kinase
VQGIPAETVILDEIVQGTYGRDHADILKAYKSHPSNFLRGLAGAIHDKVALCKGKLPVITGYFGSMSLLSNVGRGYSDLCAALCAVAMKATELQIWKEVDGIFTADPRHIPTARLLATVTSQEATELTYYGSEVSVRPV